ncbi:MAG: P-type superfamily ATPase, Ca2+-transporting ATPase [Parcubacteria group bacterium]|nr:P-type superfamily ATPase, Ca2+-transporting ATPase [Parcubacteria group bacterium]
MKAIRVIGEGEEKPFWALSVETVIAELQTSSDQGIAEAEAQNRLKQVGENVIKKSHSSPAVVILLSQFKSPLILILILAGVVTSVIGHYRDALFIFAAVFVNATLGFYQEFKAERALAELKSYLKERSRIVRDGREYELDARLIVPGDCLRLNQGDRVPADARLVFVNDFQVDETILTGEAIAVTKSTEPSDPKAGIGDQGSMVFAGTLVTQGVATAIVCRTGSATELGKIAALVADSGREETPLQKKIKIFSRQASIFLGMLTVGIFVVGILSGYSMADMFLTSVAVGVSAVPEGLPIAMTVILAIGVQRMARRKGVVRKLVAAEALGSTSIILTDKTGTLTEAKMVLSQLVPTGSATSDQLLRWALLNTNVLIENPHDKPQDWHLTGRVLESALVRAAGMKDIRADEMKKDSSILNSLPFNAVNKFSVTVSRTGKTHLLTYLGAPDILVRRSLLTQSEQAHIIEQIDTIAHSGQLVLGIATKEIASIENFSLTKETHLAGLSMQGLVAFSDPIRPGVRDAIERIERAGIRTLIMTGDHLGTAQAVAREVGMVINETSVLDAESLHTLSDTELLEQLAHIRVIARVTPADKLRVVRVLQWSGEVVAMTGDGVNDAPSIKRADIGIAMGSGTEVARDVADLVLLDDNFETIVAAIEEGRQIMHNTRKVLVYLLSSVADELFLIGGALLTGLVLPLNPLQILWVNFFSDSFPAVAFAFERNIDGITHHSSEMRGNLFSPIMRFLIVFIGFTTSAFLFVLYWALLRFGFDPEIVRTFIFASFGTYSLFLAFALRSLDKSIFSYSPFSNRYLIMGVSIGVTLIALAIYVPFLQTVFQTVSLSLYWVLGVIAVGVLNISAIEFGKWIYRRKAAASSLNIYKTQTIRMSGSR